MGALEHHGLSLVEAISNCHSYFGRLNRRGDAVAMIQSFRDNSVQVARAKTMSPEEIGDKFVIGKLFETEKTEYCDEYQKIIDAHKGEK